MFTFRELGREMGGRAYPRYYGVGKTGERKTMFERIDFQELPNTRDLGGIPTCHGTVVRAKRLLRSGMLAEASASDLARLASEFDVRVIVDFRTPEEAHEKPDPALEGAAHVFAPVLQASVMGITHEQGGASAHEAMKIGSQLGAIVSGSFDAVGYMTNFYANAVTGERSIAAYRRLFDILLERDEGAVLWHCTMGKDRAGIGSAFVLLALGVQRDIVMADYLATNAYVDGVNRRDAQRFAGMAPAELQPALRRTLTTLFEARPEYLQSAFDAMAQRDGSIEAYLTRSLGLDDGERTHLRKLYTQEA